MPTATTARTNGHADQPGQKTLRLKELVPERVPVTREDGRMMYAWVVSNQRYPALIAGELEDARNDYLATRTEVWDGTPPPDFVAAARDVVAEPTTEAIARLRDSLKAYDQTPQYKARAADWEAYLSRCLMALIPGLEAWEADLMPPEDRLGWLFDLGYFQREQEQPTEGEAQRPPEKAPTSTGVEPVRDLVGSTT